MKVSVITAFFYGNEYMPYYERMMDRNAASLEAEDDLEVIIVNDSPEERVKLTGIHMASKDWRVISNERNVGIHASRVEGLAKADGDFVLFLDQDDKLTPTAIAKILAEAKQEINGHTVIVANAWMGEADGRRLRYRNRYQKRIIDKIGVYLTVGTQIISPGHCLIPKTLITAYWKDHLLNNNGADDMLLWLLLLSNGTHFHLLDVPVYEHCYTAKNLSGSTTRMDTSYYEMIDYLQKDHILPRKKIRTLKRMVDYKAAFRRSGLPGKLMTTMMHPLLAICNMRYRFGVLTGI